MARRSREDKAEYDAADDKEKTEIEHRNPIRQIGFAQIEHIIGLDVDLSDGAYRTLSILHFYWQQKDVAYPSIETLARVRGKDCATIRRHLAELGDKGIISRARRFGTSSLTYLEDLPQEYQEAAAHMVEERINARNERESNKRAKSAKMSGQSAQKCAVEERINERTRITIEEEQEEEEPVSIEQSVSNEIFVPLMKDLQERIENWTDKTAQKVGELCDDYPDLDAHIFALEQTDKYASGFNLKYYEQCLSSWWMKHKGKSNAKQSQDRQRETGGRGTPRPNSRNGNGRYSSARIS